MIDLFYYHSTGYGFGRLVMKTPQEEPSSNNSYKPSQDHSEATLKNILVLQLADAYVQHTDSQTNMQPVTFI